MASVISAPALLVAAATTGAVAPAPAATERVVFFGDSLVHRSEKDYGLVSGLQAGLAARLPGRRFELLEKGRNGNRISDLAERLEQDVLALRPAAVVIYWDSDCSDVDESSLDPAELQALRAAYTRQLSEVLTRLRAAGAAVLLTGPTLLGEKPHGQNARDAQLDAYVALNRKVASEHGARYFDTRRAFLRWLERHRQPSSKADPLLLTADGEHLNARGTQLVTHMLLHELERWAHAAARRGAAREHSVAPGP